MFSREEVKKKFSRWWPWRQLGFPIRIILAISVNKSLQCFLPNFMSVCLPFQEKKRQIAFQDGDHGGHLGFRIRTVLAGFDLQDTTILPTTIQANWHSVQEKKRSLGFPIGTILDIFDLQVTPILPTEIQVNWPFGSEEEAKNRFSRWLPRRPSWISDRNDFNYFRLTSHPDVSFQVSSQLAFLFRRRSEN